MFYREIIEEFRNWAKSPERKPLVLRGARQVGKTTVVELFAREFDQFIRLNLEKPEERALFEAQLPFQDLLTALFIKTKNNRNAQKTLLFIDEIQNSPQAVALLRYFYEEAPDLYVIAAGSLLESIMDRKISFPVGRVEYRMLYPVSFREFLAASGEEQSLRYLVSETVPPFLHEHLTTLFKRYTTIGGMPQVVDNYIKNGDITRLQNVYESLLRSFSEDVEKYASGLPMTNYIRHILSTAFTEAGNRITFENFGGSTYRYREMKEAFNTIERTLLFTLIYPGTETEMPALPRLKMKPRLHTVDTGLVNFAAGVVDHLLTSHDISDVYRGRIAEHIVGQELQSLNYSTFNKLRFWVREKKQSTAEVDFIYPFKGWLVPIEVKSGSIGRLRSLHQYMDQAPHKIAVRVWQGPFSVENAKTIAGNVFTLLNLPFYMVNRIDLELAKLEVNFELK